MNTLLTASAFAVLVLGGCASAPPLATVPHVDLQRFMGDWYVIANIPTFIEKGAHNAIESYRLDSDGTIAVTFTFREGAFDGKPKKYSPRGFVRSDPSNASWDMQFIWPIKADYRITYLNDDAESSVSPTVPYLRELLPEYGEARHRLAVWVTHPQNKAFARATVNRMWAVMFGRPLVEPLDSIPLSGPFPPGLEILAEDFATSGHNLKRLIKTIVCTEVFQRDSRLNVEADNE